MAEMSLETEAILTRLKKEGDLIRNSGKNSIKQVNINLDKLHTTFKAINAAMLNNTAVIKQASDLENKIRQEEAERARRQGEIDELTQKDRAKAAELRAKADALRAKQELKDARGPGIFSKFKESDTKKILKTAAIIGGIGFIAGNIALGALDKKFEGEGGFLKAMEKRLETLKGETLKDIGETLNINVKKGVSSGLQQGFTDIINDPAYIQFKNDFKNIFVDGLTDVAKFVLPSLFGIGFFKYKGPEQLGKLFESIFGKKGKTPATTGKDKPKGATRTPTTSGPARQPEMFDSQGRPTKEAQRPFLERTTQAAKREAAKVTKEVLKKSPYIATGVTAYDILSGSGIPDPQKLTDDALTSFFQSGEFEKQRTTLTDIAVESATTAAVSAGVSAAVTAWSGPGAGAAAVAGGIGGGTFGFLSGTARRLYEGYQDLGILGMDDIPNQVEDAIQREIQLINSEGISPEGLRAKLSDTAQKIANTRRVLEENLQALVDEATPIEEQITALEAEEGGTQRDRNIRKQKIKSLRKQLETIREKGAKFEGQLLNTIELQEMSNQRRNQFLESIGQQPIAMLDNTGAAERLASLASAGGGAFVNTQVINYNTTNNFASNSTNNWNSGQVVVDNMTGGSGEQVALG